MQRTVTMLALVMAGTAFADEATYVFRSEEDPATPPDPAVCAAAPFASAVNVRLGASLWSVETRHRDGKVTEAKERRIGRATACLALTNVFFPAGLTNEFYVRFDLPQGAYSAQGTCTVASNAVPQPFIVLAGCTLRLVGAPAGSLGGMVTSNSIFNPLKRPGFSTGSLWTLQEYVTAPAPAPASGEGEHEHEGEHQGEGHGP